MRLASIKSNGKETAAVINKDQVISMEGLNQFTNQNWPVNLYELICSGGVQEVNHWFQHHNQDRVPSRFYTTVDDVAYAPLYRHPRKIWGIGLNYVDHASDLNENAPNLEPASFMKPDTTIIGSHDTIQIPYQSNRTTAEAELGLIIGEKCTNISEEEALSVVAGYTTIIDMTAEDILRKNPRYLTRAKSFDTFLSLGPHLVTPDEVDDVSKMKVATIINGEVHRENVISNMTFSPSYLVSFHSKVMTLLPGDIISTGTPGATVIRDGDVVECRIDGFEKLVNPVKDLKRF
jgi:2-keto-4-pentenoate hydratase/2-oxohepta-3-ene-1,7-dioic acid hydratase in catechol pathway